MLADCGTERVQMAVLKLAGGEIERMPDLVRMARVDWRDAVAAAEYPEEFKAGPIRLNQMSPGQRRAIRKRDKRQYLKWLKQ